MQDYSPDTLTLNVSTIGETYNIHNLENGKLLIACRNSEPYDMLTTQCLAAAGDN